MCRRCKKNMVKILNVKTDATRIKILGMVRKKTVYLMRIVLMNVSLFVITTMANVKHKTGFNTYNIDGGYDFGDQHDLIIITLVDECGDEHITNAISMP